MTDQATLPTKAAQAASLGIDRATLWRWTHRGKCPAERVAEAERVLGISKHELRPDVFGKREDKA